MRRRDFIAGFGGAAAWPLAARAQQAGKLPTIGFLGANTASAQRQWTDAFVQRLSQLGWIEGRTIAIEYRWAEGRFERSPALIAELVQFKVDVIVTHATANVIAAKQATSVIPIVFATVADPVGNNLVATPGATKWRLDHEVVDGLECRRRQPVEAAVERIMLGYPVTVEIRELTQRHAIGNPFAQLAIIPVLP